MKHLVTKFLKSSALSIFAVLALAVTPSFTAAPHLRAVPAGSLSGIAHSVSRAHHAVEIEIPGYGRLNIDLGQAKAGSKNDYLENKFLDFLLRAQTFTAPTSVWVALYTATPSDSGGGTEVSGGSYARVAVASSLANWAGTQSAGSTSASSGTGGATSNNGTITFPAPTANWGTVTSFSIMDASTAGNFLYWGALTTSKTVNNGDAAPSFAGASLALTED